MLEFLLFPADFMALLHAEKREGGLGVVPMSAKLGKEERQR